MEKNSKNGLKFIKKKDDLSVWKVIITDFDKDTTIFKELKKYSLSDSLLPLKQLSWSPFCNHSTPVQLIQPRTMFNS